MSDESRPDESEHLTGLLLAVGRARDKDAFRALFALLAPRVRAFVGRRGTDAATAEDAVQEAFVNVWRKAHLYDPAKSSAVTWIYTVARNAKIDLIRRSARPALDPDDPAFAADPVGTPHQEFAAARDRERLARALATLPEEQREVLRLAFFAEKSQTEIAADLGLPLGTVKSRTRLALQRLRRELGEER